MAIAGNGFALRIEGMLGVVIHDVGVFDAAVARSYAKVSFLIVVIDGPRIVEVAQIAVEPFG